MAAVALAEQVTAPVAYHAEGPVWSGGLHWVDMLAGDVLSLAPDGSVARRHVASVVAALRPRAAGGFVYAVERGFALDDGPGTPVRALPEVWTTDAVRMNEGGCDPDGRFYCGSMAYALTPGAASLYRLDPDGHVTTVFGDVTISNGLEWSPDGTIAYYVDSTTGRIDVMDYDARLGLTDRRPFAAVEAGSPDGLTVDAEGGIWVAIWGAGAVHRYDPAGRLTEVVELPATQVTACTFGGADLTDLFITTSREGLDDSAEPAAGAVFVWHPGMGGLPVRRFGG
jgi:sugar lactone lactonase YvrE